MDFILQCRYKINRIIGKGSYGEVWEGYDTVNKIVVAIKIEDTTKNPKDLQLRYEYNVYSAIGPSKGFPITYCYTSFGNNNYMIMEPVGYSLEKLFSICSKKFTLKTVLHIADQLIERLQQLHSRYYIHRDIKPDNFAIGIGKENSDKIYIIDFGLAYRFVDRNNRILPMRDKCQPTGNARYASLNNHLGFEQSRRDDLEGIAYMLIYFLTGKLPWVNACSTSKDPIQRMKIIGQIKLMTSISTICKDTPPEFEIFLRNVRQLRYEEEPKYDEYRKLFRDLFLRECQTTGSSLETPKLNIPDNLINSTENVISSDHENHSNISADISNNKLFNNDKGTNNACITNINAYENNDAHNLNSSIHYDNGDHFLLNDENNDAHFNKNAQFCENRNAESDLNLKLYIKTHSSFPFDQSNSESVLSSRSTQSQIPMVPLQSDSILIQSGENDSNLFDNFTWDWELIEGYKPLIELEKQDLSQTPATKTSSLQKKKINSPPPILQPRIKVNPLLARKNSKFKSNYSKVTKRALSFS